MPNLSVAGNVGQPNIERTRLIDVPVAKCVHSRFNTRKSRSEAQIDKLANRIRQNGFERTRALWGVEADGVYEIFAGGTRLEAARRAELETVPVMLYSGLSDEDVSRRADLDNENDEYHECVPITDVWAEYHRLWSNEGWTQQQIAQAKSVDEKTVRFRIKYHAHLPETVRTATVDGKFDEGHLESISTLTVDVDGLGSWLSTEVAQTELAREVLNKHVGKTANIKPKVANVREAAKRWKSLIAAAETVYQSLPDEPAQWREQFVEHLAADKARTEAAVNRAQAAVMDARRKHDQAEADRLRAAADEKAQEALRLEAEQQRLAYLEQQTARLLCGDARKLIDQAPDGFQLLLTDPPYGQNYESNRRVTSAKKGKIAGDTPEAALALLENILQQAFPKMADDASCLIFTGWRLEPEFRRVIEACGFEIKGSLVWVKHNHGSGDLAGSFAPQHERIIHAVKGKPKLLHRYPDVLYGKDRQNSPHPTEKPRDLLQQLIEATTEPGQTVVDPFFGSGNTLLEAYSLGREFWGTELEEHWHRAAVDTVYHLAGQRLQSRTVPLAA